MDKGNRTSKKRIRNILSYLYLAAVAAVIIIAAASLFLVYPRNGFDSGSVISLTDGWEYSVDGSTPKAIELPQTRNIPEAEDASITRTLPSKLEKGTSIAVYSSFQNIRVEIGGKQVLSYKGTDGLLYTNVPVTQILFINMKSEYEGQKITIHYSSPLSSRKGVMHEVFLGYKADIIYHMIRERMVIMLAGMLLIAIGIIVLCYKAFSGTGGVIGEALGYQGIYMTLIGIFFVLQTGMNQIFFKDLNWSRFIEFYAIMIIPTAFILELDAVEKHVFRHIADMLSLLFIIASAVEGYLVAFRHIDYMYINSITYVMFAISILFAAVSVLIIAIKDKKLFQEMHWMIYSFAFLAVGGVGEILLYYIDSEKEDCRMFACGVIGHFLCTMRWIMQERDIIETQKERAVQQAEAKSTFLANMSHEIRTPVIAILGMNDMIIKDCRDEEIMTYAKDMHDAAKDVLGLINNILDYSKIESGRMEIVGDKYSLLSLLHGLSEDTRTALGAKNVEFVMNVSPSLPSVFWGDEGKIRQILWNVLQNAAKFTENGTVMLSVNGKMKDENSMRLQFVVSDTGCGMSRDVRQRVFESFNHDYSSETPGIGLGLSIAGNLARKMGGTMEVKSREGEGSQLTLWITQQVIDMSGIGEYKDTAHRTAYGGHRVRADILTVDDETINLEIMKRALRGMEVKADTAQSGEEAIEACRKKRYDVIFLDYIMPGMDGAAALERIRQDIDGRNNNTPAVLLTAGTGNDTRVRSREKGFADCLIKPVNEAELKQLLKKLHDDEKLRQGRSR